MFSPKGRRAAALGLALVLLAGLAWAQGQEYIRANYTKYEFQIPMRDGKKLFTAVYVPKDASQQCPILLTRTPYSVAPYGVDKYPGSLGLERWAKEGYIVALQDVRGRLKSEGQFLDMRPIIHDQPGRNTPSDTDESTDTWDTIDWLVKNVPHNNGKVGMWGISYPGFYAAEGLVDSHPALKAVSPQAPIADWFVGDDFHHNGAVYLAHAFGFFSGFGWPADLPRFDPGTADGYRFFLDAGPLASIDDKYFHGRVAFWKDLIDHPNYDEFWKARNTLPHLKGVRPAVMTVGGWFDAEDLYGALNTYKSIEKQSPNTYNILVMGPWFHGGWMRGDGDQLGEVRFGSKTSEYYREKILYPFFEYYLKGKGESKLPEASVFETGTNTWRNYDAWPPKNAAAKTLYLEAAGKLSLDSPNAPRGAAFDEYLSDPAHPVPFNNTIAFGMTREHMLDDQRFASTRPDVLTYQTEPLTGDLTLAGPISPDLYVSTTGTDSDFVVKLIDVYPNDFPGNAPAGQQMFGPSADKMGGYQQLVRGELFRGRFRNSYEKPEAFEPGKVARIRYTMPDINHTFRRGHRIMIQVQSSWFPLVDRNPQKFVDIYHAKPEDFQQATERVYHRAGEQSKIEILVLK